MINNGKNVIINRGKDKHHSPRPPKPLTPVIEKHLISKHLANLALEKLKEEKIIKGRLLQIKEEEIKRGIYKNSNPPKVIIPVAPEIIIPSLQPIIAPRLPEEKIPRLIHFFWIGDIVPDMSYKLMQRAKDIHPGWIVKFWHGVPKEMPSDVKRILYNTKYLTCKSDIFRWWVLHEYGGIYLDCDIYCYRNFSPLLSQDHFFAHPLVRSKGIPCAVLGSAPKSAIFTYAMKRVREVNEIVVKNGGHSRLAYGPCLLKNIMWTHQKESITLPAYQFYPFFDAKLSQDFAYGTPEAQLKMIQDAKFKEPPYGCHIFGMSTKPLRLSRGTSHWIQNCRALDDILFDLPEGPKVIWLGNSNQRRFNWMSSYMRGHRLDLKFVSKDEPYDLKISDKIQ